jgi:hypothetical protein
MKRCSGPDHAGESQSSDLPLKIQQKYSDS